MNIACALMGLLAAMILYILGLWAVTGVNPLGV